MITEFQGDYRFLSNFWPVDIEYEGVRYPSTEHAFQAAKSLETEERKKIARLSSPDQAKKAGRKLVCRSDWESVRIQVMLEVLRLKFKDPDLREKLLATGNQPLVEGNWWGDVFWGVCRGQGQNHLGKLLMRVRQEISEGRL